MKNIFLIISIFFFSCEKSENLPAIYNSIEGKWLAQGTIPEETQCISMKMECVILITV
jgi:amino acid permease